MRILILDPDLSVQKSVKWTFFHESSVSFLVADSLAAATDILLNSAVDLLISDIKFAPENDNTISQICQTCTPKVPILFTLTESDLATPGVQLQLGSEDYIFKPFSVQDLLFRLRKLMHIHPPSVMLVSRHDDVIQQVTWSLASSGISVWPVMDPLTLSEHCRGRNAKAILYDILSLGTDGPDLFRQARRMAPVMALAPLDALTPEQTTCVLDADDFVGIPFSPTHLETRLKKMLRTAKAEERSFPREQTELDQLKVALHHEIRNPLTSILIGAQALSHQFSEGTTEKNVLSTIENSSQRIKSIMDALATNQTFEVEEYTNGIQMLKLT